jgi:hypothetical protein
MAGFIARVPVVIEYDRRRPFAIVARETKLNHKSEQYEVITQHDVEYCRRFDLLYRNESGCGGDGKTHCLDKLVGNGPLREVWAAKDVQFTKLIRRKGDWVEIPAKESDLAKLGYKRLKQPRLCKGSWGDTSRDPFEICDEGKTVYCPRCKDWLLDEDVTACGHLQWCDNCSEFIDLKTGRQVEMLGEKCGHLPDKEDDD